MSTFSKVIEVGTGRYTVIHSDAALAEFNKERMDSGLEVGLAALDTWRNVIILPERRHANPVSEDYIRECMVHELGHAMFRNYGVNIEETQIEEDVCLMLEHALIPLLRHNPALVKWLCE